MCYTERFTETHRPDTLKTSQTLGTGVHDCGWFSMRDYHRAFFDINCGAIATLLEASVYQAQDTNGTGMKIISDADGNQIKVITALTGADDNAQVGIELRTEELDVDNGFDCVTLRLHSEGNTVLGAKLFRFCPRFAEVGVTQYDEIVD